MGNESVVFKVNVLGMPQTGQNEFCSLMQPQQQLFESDFSNFQYRASDRSIFDVWDLSSLEPHLWNHYSNGVDGIIYLIQDQETNEQEKLQITIRSLINAVANNFEVPVLIVISQAENSSSGLKIDKNWFEKEVFFVFREFKDNYDVVLLDLKHANSKQRT